MPARQAFQSFEATLVDMKIDLPSEITLKTAIDAALRLTTGLYAPIYSQIDPMKLGEDRRALDIARDYGQRFSEQSENLKPNALERLLVAYPSHNFVIDREEAGTLFESVREPSPAESSLLEHLGTGTRIPRVARSFFPVSGRIDQKDLTDKSENQNNEEENGNSKKNGKESRRNSAATIQRA